ncbi:replication protein A 70 kDa DNA-binding subunit [Hyalella azteca]|uniref:Replication protein A 70 kDa DNA-binding subunit n=1 Tax=Hyalella azteca TaxID=294128 RepID=A0A8B7P7B5_HYAAZ|nr:replication protein A 70 kDa DNA-binding subunit [Hyalella azteca]
MAEQLPAENISASDSLPDGFPNVCLIGKLKPYLSEWSICARVIQKSGRRSYMNKSKNYFSMVLLDESGEIQAVAFDEECAQFYDKIEVNKAYYFCSAWVKKASDFNSCKHDYEVRFTDKTKVELCTMDEAIPFLQFEFVPLGELEREHSKFEKCTHVDVIGVCDWHDVTTAHPNGEPIIGTKGRSAGRSLRMGKFYLQDGTGNIFLTLWQEQTDYFDVKSNPVIAIKRAKIDKRYGGLTLDQSSRLQIDPDIEEAHQLKAWWKQTGERNRATWSSVPPLF